MIDGSNNYYIYSGISSWVLYGGEFFYTCPHEICNAICELLETLILRHVNFLLTSLSNPAKIAWNLQDIKWYDDKNIIKKFPHKSL